MFRSLSWPGPSERSNETVWSRDVQEVSDSRDRAHVEREIPNHEVRLICGAARYERVHLEINFEFLNTCTRK